MQIKSDKENVLSFSFYLLLLNNIAKGVTLKSLGKKIPKTKMFNSFLLQSIHSSLLHFSFHFFPFIINSFFPLFLHNSNLLEWFPPLIRVFKTIVSSTLNKDYHFKHIK